MVFAGQARDVPLLRREALEPGNRIPGPALLTEYSSTILVPPFAAARVDGFGNLFLNIDNAT